MKTKLYLLLWLGLAGVTHASTTATPAPAPRSTVRGIVGIAAPADVAATPRSHAPFDAARTPVLQDPAVAALIEPFIGMPLTPQLADWVAATLRNWLQQRGHSFTTVYVPPQDVTDGILRIVVQRAKLDGDLQIEGAKYFSVASYRAAVPLAAGDEIDAAVVQAGVNRLNRGGYRRVVVAAEPGATAGTTKLVLRTRETRPWSLSAGYNNTGTAVTDEDRVTAAVVWGNAFDRGDTLGYSFSADPALEHSLSHSANYSAVFKSGHSLTAFGSHSTLESALPAPLTQEGKSWQTGLRYGVPLAKTTGGWERALNFAADFKYSDNTLEFAAIPVTDTVTHLAQLGATFSMSRRTPTQGLAWSASLHASPGGVTAENDDEAFARARFGAQATYVYGRFEGQYSRALPAGFSLSTTASLQLASGPLLGTEQLNGAGSGGVRGYRESSAFSDEGVVVNTELHLPAFSPFKDRGQADLFAFVDAAALWDLGSGATRAELASSGVGVNYRFSRVFSLSAAYGWQWKPIPHLADQGAGHGHLSASVRF
jgi:hemolysin activation/secretion protein